MRRKYFVKSAVCIYTALCISIGTLGASNPVFARENSDLKIAYETPDKLYELPEGYKLGDSSEGNTVVTDIINETVSDNTVSDNSLQIEAVPGLYSRATRDNVMAVVNAYDKDGAYILSKAESMGTNILSWWNGSSLFDNTWGLSSFDTAVHECNHGITGGIFTCHYYVGDGVTFDVPVTDEGPSVGGYYATKVHTDEFARNIPANLRTFRYDTYVSTTSKVSANLTGVYGLLDEMDSYYSGARTNYKLYQYLKDQNASNAEIKTYWSTVYSILNAYAEFKYWTLGYMLYLRSNYPSVYQNIINNTSYCRAYGTVCIKFENLINQVNEDHKAFYGREVFTSMGDYNLLMGNVLNKSEYIAMDNTIKSAGGVSTKPVAPIDKAKVTAFVERMYLYALNRKAETKGLNDWVDKMQKGYTGAQVAQGFFFSQEMINRNLSNEQFLEVLYKVFMNRGSDASGKAYWLNLMDNGVGREGVFNGFTKSTEFSNICKEYGIEPGEIQVSEGRDKNYGATLFVSRLYSKALGRKADIPGLNDWSGQLADRKKSASQIATIGFFHSQEFMNKKYNDVEYIKVLYRTFMGREYDEQGLQHWISKKQNGMSRDEILNSFAASEEFRNIMAQYGL